MLSRRLCQAICYLFKKLRQQRKFRHAITGFPAEWRPRRDGRNSILMASYWWRVTTHASWDIYFNQSDWSTSLIWVVTRHQHGIFSLVSQTSFVGCLFTPRQLFRYWRLCLGIEIVFVVTFSRHSGSGSRARTTWYREHLALVGVFALECEKSLLTNLYRWRLTQPLS